ncbi:hypothetical protein, partial [Thiolapillus sp.]|uniref:hypothetical protein n=1 Tax=Thiolapillus sp. TaxID=2017437 RepID=UPI003AF95117
MIAATEEIIASYFESLLTQIYIPWWIFIYICFNKRGMSLHDADKDRHSRHKREENPSLLLSIC